MSKVITSPSKRWPGTVTLSDPLTLPQAEAIGEGLRIFRDYEDKNIPYLTIDKAHLIGILPCVEKWDLQNFSETVTLDTFPMSPQGERRKLVDWLWNEVYSKIYIGETENPKRVKADAFLYASEGQYSEEIEKLNRIERFGLEAITGRRVFLNRDYRRLMYAQTIVSAVYSSQRSQNWVEWAQSNPELAKIFSEASKLGQAKLEASKLHADQQT